MGDESEYIYKYNQIQSFRAKLEFHVISELMYKACKIEMVSRAAATKYMPQHCDSFRPSNKPPTITFKCLPLANKSFIFHHQQVLLCLVTVTFSLASVCLASCKRHVVQVGREYLLEPSPCARSTPTTKEVCFKAALPCHGKLLTIVKVVLCATVHGDEREPQGSF